MSETSAAAGGAPGPRTVDLDSMSLDQLNQLKQQEDARLTQITAQYQQLRAASARFASAKTALSSLSSSSSVSGRDVMVPLTASLYAPGRIKDPKTVMIELGTGFYADRPVKDALAFLDRKQKLVDANSENVLKAAQATRANAEAVGGAMQGKMLEIRAKSEGRAFRDRAEGRST